MKKFEIKFRKSARLCIRGYYVGVFYEKITCFDREPSQSPDEADVWKALYLYVYLIPFMPIQIVFRRKNTEYASEREFLERQRAICERADREDF